MEERIIDLTELEQRKKRNPNPCDTCQVGHASWGVSLPYWENGHKKQKITTTNCHDDCQRFKDYIKREISNEKDT